MTERDFDDADLAELRELMARGAPEDVVWEVPPPGMWERIAAGVEEPQRPARPARRRGWAIGAAMAAAAAAVVVATVAIVGGDDDAPRIVSAVELEPLGASGSGRAELVEQGGELQLRLDTEGLDPGDSYLELWMIDPTVTRLVSLGPLRADGVYSVPAGVDPAAFPIVDVSVEPVDGDPTHSGDSVLRGELQL